MVITAFLFAEGGTRNSSDLLTHQFRFLFMTESLLFLYRGREVWEVERVEGDCIDP
jgi:hypothetical protein